MSLKIYVPGDAAALSVGAEAVAKAMAEQIASRRLDATVVRNGSRGMFWLEPLVEVETPRGRDRLRTCVQRKRCRVCSTRDSSMANRIAFISALPKKFPTSRSRSG